MTAAEIAEVLSPGALDSLAVAEAHRPWQALAACSRPSRPTAMSAATQASSCTSTSSSSGASRCVEPDTAWWAIARARPTPASDGVKRGLTRFEYVHVMIDDHTRLAYAEVLPTLTSAAARSSSCSRGVELVCRARRADQSGDERQRLLPMSPTPIAGPSPSWDCATCASVLTGRAPTERQSDSSRRSLNEWAYERIYGSSSERTAALPLYLERYNFRRPHGSLGHQPPASRLTNVVGNYS